LCRLFDVEARMLDSGNDREKVPLHQQRRLVAPETLGTHTLTPRPPRRPHPYSSYPRQMKAPRASKPSGQAARSTPARRLKTSRSAFRRQESR
jgi:hypothetical protein